MIKIMIIKMIMITIMIMKMKMIMITVMIIIMIMKMIMITIDLSNNTPKTTEKSNKDSGTKGQRLKPVFVMLEPKVNKMDYWTLTGKEGFINE
jgi:hypothetical protein